MWFMIDYFMSNEALLAYLGKQIKQMRINAQMSQQDLADKSGISRATLTLVENGKGAKLDTLISLLRALQKLEILNNFETNAMVSPLLIARNKGKIAKKVYKRRVENVGE